MQIHRFKNIYSGYMWIIDVRKEVSEIDRSILNKLSNKFRVRDINANESYSKESTENSFEKSFANADAAVFPVEEQKTGKYGVLLLIIGNIDTNAIAHESVHIADYFYEVCRIDAHSFSEGNEAYAYLVGWTAGKISEVLINNKKYDSEGE